MATLTQIALARRLDATALMGEAGDAEREERDLFDRIRPPRLRAAIERESAIVVRDILAAKAEQRRSNQVLDRLLSEQEKAPSLLETDTEQGKEMHPQFTTSTAQLSLFGGTE